MHASQACAAGECTSLRRLCCQCASLSLCERLVAGPLSSPILAKHTHLLVSRLSANTGTPSLWKGSILKLWDMLPGKYTTVGDLSLARNISLKGSTPTLAIGKQGQD